MVYFCVLFSATAVLVDKLNWTSEAKVVLVEPAEPNLCWVSCAINRRDFLRLHLCRQTFASLWGASTRCASLWSSNSRGGSWLRKALFIFFLIVGCVGNSFSHPGTGIYFGTIAHRWNIGDNRISLITSDLFTLFSHFSQCSIKFFFI